MEAKGYVLKSHFRSITQRVTSLNEVNPGKPMKKIILFCYQKFSLTMRTRACHIMIFSQKINHRSGNWRFICIETRKMFREDPSTRGYPFFTCKKSRWPLSAQKKLYSNWGLLYSKRPARPHGFNEANDKLIRVGGAEICRPRLVRIIHARFVGYLSPTNSDQFIVCFVKTVWPSWSF